MKTAEHWINKLDEVSTERDQQQWVEAIQQDARNQALTDAANKVKALSAGLNCSCECDSCVARKNDVATILEMRSASPSNEKADSRDREQP
jgi:uncharacterized protein YggE